MLTKKLTSHKLNKELMEELEHLKLKEGIFYLLDIMFGLNLYKNAQVIGAMNMNKLITYDIKEDRIKFKHKVFAEEREKLPEFAWVKDWAKKFFLINKERKANYAECQRRMAELFREYPYLTKEIIYEARDRYFQTIEDVQFLRKPERFIREGLKSDKSYPIMTFVELIVEKENVSANNVL